jgi:hypothetical protein
LFGDRQPGDPGRIGIVGERSRPRAEASRRQHGTEHQSEAVGCPHGPLRTARPRTRMTIRGQLQGCNEMRQGGGKTARSTLLAFKQRPCSGRAWRKGCPPAFLPNALTGLIFLPGRTFAPRQTYGQTHSELPQAATRHVVHSGPRIQACVTIHERRYLATPGAGEWR